MYKRLLFTVVFCCILGFVYAFFHRTTTPREVSFDHDWLFVYGAHPEVSASGYQPLADTLCWTPVDLPHDFAILPCQGLHDSIVCIGPFSKASPGKAATGWTMGGEGWYLKTFALNELTRTLPKSHHVFICFDGVYNQCEVWVNGQEVGQHLYGYTPFRYDLSAYLPRTSHGDYDTSTPITLAVRAVNTGKNSRWYAGAGIYRHVSLLLVPSFHADKWQTFCRTTRLSQISEGGKTAASAEVMVSATFVAEDIAEDDAVQETAYWRLQLIDPTTRRPVAEWEDNMPMRGRTLSFDQKLIVPNAQLWHPDRPFLYTLRLLVRRASDTDTLSLRVGLRTLSFSSAKGFRLNEQPIILRGACIHHDNGVLGAAAFPAAERRKVSLLKAAGFNALRGSHNPMSEALMEACDETGMLFIDEAFDMWHKKKNKQDYHLYFDSLACVDLSALVCRDRNHPSVIMYSIGNEIPERIEDEGVKIAADLRATILDHDDTRPVTMGINSVWNADRTGRLSVEPACRALDVAGYNYRVWCYEPEHLRDTTRVMYGSETVYNEMASEYARVTACPWVLGQFLWTGMDYIGEAGIANCQTLKAEENVHFFMPWPWYNGWCGLLDLTGSRKPQSYYADVVWQRTPLALNVEPARYGAPRPTVSYWGWIDEAHHWWMPDGAPSDSLRVNVYSRDTLVDLFLNDSLVAHVAINDTSYMGHAWVAYQPGTLTARSPHSLMPSEANTLTTPGRPVRLRLTPSSTTLRANGQDLSFVLIEAVDATDHVVPLSCPVVIEISPESAWAGSGNAAPDDMESFRSLTPRLYQGRAQVIMRASRQAATLTLRVTADSLAPASLSISCQ